MKIERWIDGYSNCGTKVKTAAIKQELASLQARHPEKNYELTRENGLWYISENEEEKYEPKKITLEQLEKIKTILNNQEGN